MVSDCLNTTNISWVTNKMIYRFFMSALPPPKIVRESTRDFSQVWKRLHYSIVDSRVRDLFYLLIHNKLPTRERLFRIAVKPDPYCCECPGAEISDLEHIFCSCLESSVIWAWVKNKVLSLVGSPALLNWELLNLFFPITQHENGLVWLISCYVWYIWENVVVLNRGVSLEKFFGFLTFKFRGVEANVGNVLPGISDYR